MGGDAHRERSEVVRRLAEARRLGPPGTAAVREAAAAQRALKAVWFQQVCTPPHTLTAARPCSVAVAAENRCRA